MSIHTALLPFILTLLTLTVSYGMAVGLSSEKSTFPCTHTHTKTLARHCQVEKHKEGAFVVLHIPLCLIHHSSFDLSSSNINTCFIYLTLLLLTAPAAWAAKKNVWMRAENYPKKGFLLLEKKGASFSSISQENVTLVLWFIKNNTLSAVLIGTISLEEIRSSENCYLSSCYL